MSLTRERLMKMNKNVSTSIALDYKERFDSTLSAINDELKQLKTDFRKLDSELAISRNVNDKLTKQLIFCRKKMLGKRTILSSRVP